MCLNAWSSTDRQGRALVACRSGYFSTTQLYINLAGEEFREEAELLERRLLGVEDLGRS